MTVGKKDQVVALCDGRLTMAEVAEIAECSLSFVSQVLKRAREDGAGLSVRPVARGPRPDRAEPDLPSVRRMVRMDGETHRAIRDMAEAEGVPFDDLAGVLLRDAARIGRAQ